MEDMKNPNSLARTPLMNATIAVDTPQWVAKGTITNVEVHRVIAAHDENGELIWADSSTIDVTVEWNDGRTDVVPFTDGRFPRGFDLV